MTKLILVYPQLDANSGVENNKGLFVAFKFCSVHVTSNDKYNCNCQMVMGHVSQPQTLGLWVKPS